MLNTFTNSTDLPMFVCFKTDLSTDEAREANVIALLVSEFDSFRSLGWARAMEWWIGEALRQEGVLSKFPPCAENNFATDAERRPLVVGRKGQMIGLFEVSDWRIGINVVREALAAWHILEFSKLGWRDPHEMILRIVYPKQYEESFEPVMATLEQWMEELRAEDPFRNLPPPNPPAP